MAGVMDELMEQLGRSGGDGGIGAMLGGLLGDGTGAKDGLGGLGGVLGGLSERR